MQKQEWAQKVGKKIDLNNMQERDCIEQHSVVVLMMHYESA